MSEELTDEQPEQQPQKHFVAVLLPEDLVAAAKGHWDALKAHPAALGRARRYGAAQAIRAAVRVGLAALDQAGS